MDKNEKIFLNKSRSDTKSQNYFHFRLQIIVVPPLATRYRKVDHGFVIINITPQNKLPRKSKKGRATVVRVGEEWPFKVKFFFLISKHYLVKTLSIFQSTAPHYLWRSIRPKVLSMHWFRAHWQVRTRPVWCCNWTYLPRPLMKSSGFVAGCKPASNLVHHQIPTVSDY